MTQATLERTLSQSTLDILRRAGNPFRNYFARNPDDEVCTRFHVPELYARERSQLVAVVDLYRAKPGTHSELVPILGNKGAGKTHLLHSIKHSQEGDWQLLVTPGTYQKDNDFLEYLLFQVIDTLLGGGKQKGRRPLEYLSEKLTRDLLHKAMTSAAQNDLLDLFPAMGLGRWTRKLGLGTTQAQERSQWFLDNLANTSTPLRRLCQECSLTPENACTFLTKSIEKSVAHDSAGIMRGHIFQGFARAALLGDESDLANFLTYGFAELDLKVRPSRQTLVLSLFKALMQILQETNLPVVLAFDQLEDLLLARRSDDSHRTAEAFFAGIVQAMHQIDGIAFLVFAERGLWNRFIPSLDGYIQDRLNNPIHLPEHGTLKALRLEAPSPELVRRVVEARLRPLHEELPEKTDSSSIFPFTEEQVQQIARTEPTLRDMLQQFRQLFDFLVYGEVQKAAYETADTPPARPRVEERTPPVEAAETITPRLDPPANRLTPHEPTTPVHVRSVVVVETQPTPTAPAPSAPATINLLESWDQELAAARSQLEPEGALAGSTREIQAGLGTFLRICHEHGVKVGPWRLQHVVPEWTFGEHPTYGVVSLAHWACKDGQPWKVGVGLFLAKGPGKPKDLEIKLASLDATPPVLDHLILLRTDDDLALTGKSKTLWQDSQKKGHHARLEPATLDTLSILYAFPRWLTTLSESLSNGQPLPNLADLIQDKCEKLLEQVCMPISA